MYPRVYLLEPSLHPSVTIWCPTGAYPVLHRRPPRIAYCHICTAIVLLEPSPSTLLSHRSGAPSSSTLQVTSPLQVFSLNNTMHQGLHPPTLWDVLPICLDVLPVGGRPTFVAHILAISRPSSPSSKRRFLPPWR